MPSPSHSPAATGERRANVRRAPCPRRERCRRVPDTDRGAGAADVTGSRSSVARGDHDVEVAVHVRHDHGRRGHGGGGGHPGRDRRRPSAAGAVSLTDGTASTQNFDTLATRGHERCAACRVVLRGDRHERATLLYAAGTGSDNAGDTYSFGAAASTGAGASAGCCSGSLDPDRSAPSSRTTRAARSPTLDDRVHRRDVARRRRPTAVARRPARLPVEHRRDQPHHRHLDRPRPPRLREPDHGRPRSARSTATPPPIAPRSAGSITGLTIPDGASFWIRWTDFEHHAAPTTGSPSTTSRSHPRSTVRSRTPRRR